MSSRPEFPSLTAACAEIAALAPRSAAEGPWRSGALAALARHGVLAMFVPRDAGGTGAAEQDIVAALAAIAERCLTTALALSQWAAAVRIIAGGPPAVRERLPRLAAGAEFTTVGISQLTTSRQHGQAPALVATSEEGVWRLDGVCPWVTGADSVATIVTGAATDDGGRRFFVVTAESPGLEIDPPLALLALDGSRTAEVRFRGVRVTETISAGPDGPRTGGLATTALAVGATRASIALVAGEAAARPALAPIAAGLAAEATDLTARLDAAATHGVEPADRDRLRADANGLVVRAAQAALTAAKGAGFVRGHPAERLARESLFFLVWSCPQAVSGAVLCELAGLG
jgi:alkylation response protein AidB-like acyl-CoA dehydrogenase